MLNEMVSYHRKPAFPQAFGLDTPELLEQRGIDVGVLFGNLKDVVDVSERFLDTLQLEVKNAPSVAEQHVGR